MEVFVTRKMEASNHFLISACSAFFVLNIFSSFKQHFKRDAALKQLHAPPVGIQLQTATYGFLHNHFHI